MGLKEFLHRIFFRGANPFEGYETNRLRPPGALDETRFMALCIRCNRCLEVCPYHAVQRAGVGVAMGTPYVFPEERACRLCMACPPLCPTGALDRDLLVPENVRMGKAKIDSALCYSLLFLEHDKLPDQSGARIGALCNTCYNVCPLADTAIMLKDNLFPVILDGCVGCGICVERCPVRPKRAVNVIPAGMGRTDEAGFHYQKAKKRHEAPSGERKADPSKPLKGEDLLKEKSGITGTEEAPKFTFPGEPPKTIEGWE